MAAKEVDSVTMEVTYISPKTLRFFNRKVMRPVSNIKLRNSFMANKMLPYRRMSGYN